MSLGGPAMLLVSSESPYVNIYTNVIAPCRFFFGGHATCTIKLLHLKCSELIWDLKNVTHFPYGDDCLYTRLPNFVFDPVRRFLTLTAACTSNHLRRGNVSRFWDPRLVVS